MNFVSEERGSTILVIFSSCDKFKLEKAFLFHYLKTIFSQMGCIADFSIQYIAYWQEESC